MAVTSHSGSPPKLPGKWKMNPPTARPSVVVRTQIAPRAAIAIAELLRCRYIVMRYIRGARTGVKGAALTGGGQPAGSATTKRELANPFGSR